MTEQKNYLHLGCGKIILPGPRPNHHGLVNEGIYQYAKWWNVDRNWSDGVDECVDLFTYPWPWPSDSFDGALAAHLIEHIPHEIKLADEPPPEWDAYEWACRREELKQCQDGFYAFLSELFRVLTPGARAYILSPYAFSSGAMTDPSHTRYITEHTMTHSMQPDAGSPFRYETAGLNMRLVEPVRFNINQLFSHLIDQPDRLQFALQTQLNVAYEICGILEAVKDESDRGQHAVSEGAAVGG